MPALRIVVNEYYLYENNLVRVVGAKGMGTDTMRYLIQWGDSQGRACSAEVTRRELSAAPSMERLYQDYQTALNAICNQANRIEELEAVPSPLDRLWHSSTDLLSRFKARPTTKQTLDRMMSEVLELVIASSNAFTTNQEDVAAEAADVLVTMINALSIQGISKEQFAKAIDTVIAKNDAKTPDTHQLNVQSQGVERKPQAMVNTYYAQLQALKQRNGGG